MQKGKQMITQKDKFEYARIMGEDIDVMSLHLWDESDFYSLYLNTNYKGMPSEVLWATYQVVMYNIMLHDKGLTAEQYRLFSVGYGRNHITMSQTITNNHDMKRYGKDYFIQFSKAVLKKHLEVNLDKFTELEVSDRSVGMEHKVVTETNMLMDFIFERNTHEKTGLNFNQSDKDDIVGYIGGEVLLLPHKGNKVVQDYVRIWGLALNKYLQHV